MMTTTYKKVLLGLICAFTAGFTSVLHAAEFFPMWPFKFLNNPPSVQTPLQKANLSSVNVQVVEKKNTLLSNTDNTCMFESADGVWLYQKNETKNNESWTLTTGSTSMLAWDIPHLDIYSIWAPMDCTKIQLFDVSIKNRKYALWQSVGMDIWQEGPAKDWRFGHLLPYDQEHKGLPISNRYSIHDTIGLTNDGALAFAKLNVSTNGKDADASPEWLVSPKIMEDIHILVSHNTPLFKTITYRIKSENKMHLVQIDFNTNVLKKWETLLSDSNKDVIKDIAPNITVLLPNDTRYDLMRVHQFLWNDLMNTSTALNPTMVPNSIQGSKTIVQSSISFTTTLQQREMSIDFNNPKILNIMSMFEKMLEPPRPHKPNEAVVTIPNSQVKVL